MEREVRYCTTEDGVRIAYCVRGAGLPIVMQSLFLNQMSAETNGEPIDRNFISKQRMVIRFDGRGVGLSQRNLDDFSMEARVHDLEAVVDATQIETFDLMGEMWSGPIALAYAVRHPGRVLHLVLARTYARAADITSRERWRPLVEMARTNWRMAAETFGRIDNPADQSARTYPILSEGVNGEDAAKWLEQQYEIDVTELLPAISVPTLVIASRSDRSIRFSLSRDLAARIPDARFAELDLQRPELDDAVLKAVAEFTNESEYVPGGGQSGTAFRAILFTDLVGHTEMMSRLGDERGREVLREHERITREVLKAHGGTEVKTMGDGFMASFGSVTRAVECAVALQRAMESLTPDPSPETPPHSTPPTGEGRPVGPLKIRCGLNAGEPIEEAGDLFGATVILASRIAARAEGGEILVADTVRGLCAGKGFLFADRGEFVAKGFEEPVRVCEVRWRDG